MIYKFITDSDFELGIKKYFLDQVTAGTEVNIIKKAEDAAVTLIKSKLNSRYILTLLFPIIKDWNEETEYTAGTYVALEDIIYKASATGTNESPDEEDSEFWNEDDPRDGLLIALCVDITIYFLLKRINPRKLSDEVIASYNRAINWLEDVHLLHENPDFPLIVTGGMELRAGSNPPQDHYF